MTPDYPHIPKPVDTITPICAERRIHFGTAVGRWPTFGGVTVPKWIPLTGNMLGWVSRPYVP
jgi:hypothetical protein